MALPPFQTALDEHRDALGRFLAATVGPQDAEDCLQETLIAALRAYPRLREGSNVRAWLFTIARNKALDEHRARARRPVPVLAAESGAAAQPDGSGPDADLWTSVRSLPPKQRAAVVLRFVNDLPHRDVAAVLDCSEAAARRSLHEGLAKLRGMGMIDPLEERLRVAAGGLAVPEFDGAKFAGRAADEGLADVAYAHSDSPLGPLLLAATPRGLACVSYSEFREEDEVLERLAARLSPRVIEAPARLDDVRRQLDDYFVGRRTEFDLTIDWGLVTDFGRRVLRRTAEIPFGEVATYGDVAAGIGSPGGARATGNALGRNPMPIVVPCHRVVRGGGNLGGYTGGVERKELLLSLERSAGERLW